VKTRQLAGRSAARFLQLFKKDGNLAHLVNVEQESLKWHKSADELTKARQVAVPA
jgi:hypothetical protein